AGPACDRAGSGSDPVTSRWWQGGARPDNEVDMNFENELIWTGRGIRIASLAGDSARVDGRRSSTLPAALVSFAERAERITWDEDLAVVCNDAMARKLTNRMWQRAHELAAKARLASPLPEDVSRLGRELSPQKVIEVLGAVVGAH